MEQIIYFIAGMLALGVLKSFWKLAQAITEEKPKRKPKRQERVYFFILGEHGTLQAENGILYRTESVIEEFLEADPTGRYIMYARHRVSPSPYEEDDYLEIGYLDGEGGRMEIRPRTPEPQPMHRLIRW